MNPESAAQPTTPAQAEAHVRSVLDAHLKDGLTDEVMARKFHNEQSLNDLLQFDPALAVELAEKMFDWNDLPD